MLSVRDLNFEPQLSLNSIWYWYLILVESIATTLQIKTISEEKESSLPENTWTHSDQCNYFRPYLALVPCTWKKLGFYTNVCASPYKNIWDLYFIFHAAAPIFSTDLSKFKKKANLLSTHLLKHVIASLN